VYPVEVESVLSTHPDVAAIAIVPRADNVMGEIGVAVVVPRDPARVPTLDELRAFAAAQVAAYKLPEAIALRSDLPLTAMEKVDRSALVAELNDLVT
jgi:acyl-CoA synthetase (AMP-forming)/AMP-acid ligase II